MSAAMISIRRKKLINRFREAGATDAEHAVTLESLGERSSWIFEQMRRHGVFVTVQEGRYYMREAVAAEFRRHLRKRALLTVGILLFVFLTLWGLGVFGR